MLYVDFLAGLRRDVDLGRGVDPDEAAALRDADELCLRALPISETTRGIGPGLDAVGAQRALDGWSDRRFPRGTPEGTVHFLDLTCPDGSGDAACGTPFHEAGRMECRAGAFLLRPDRCRACEAVLLPVVAA